MHYSLYLVVYLVEYQHLVRWWLVGDTVHVTVLITVLFNVRANATCPCIIVHIVRMDRRHACLFSPVLNFSKTVLS